MTEKKATIIGLIIIAAILIYSVGNQIANRSDSVSGSADHGTDFWSDY